MAVTITNFTPTNGPVGSIVIINGTGFDATPANNTVTVGGGSAVVTSATTTQLLVQMVPACVTGAIAVTVSGSTATSVVNFTVTPTLAVDSYDGAPDDGALSGTGLLPYLRARLKDTETDIAELGVQVPTWSDAALLRYLELARSEYSRHRPKRATTVMTTTANQQSYTVPSVGGVPCLGVRDVFWSPAGCDLDEIAALAAMMGAGGGVLWGGGVPVVGRVYFDSPASIQVWNILRETWRQTFGGKWRDGDTPDSFWLLPCPTEDNLNVVVRYSVEKTWSDIPWQDRDLILGHALLSAIEALTYQIVASSPAQGQKLNLGLRALTDLIQQKYVNALNLRAPGITAGRS